MGAEDDCKVGETFGGRNINVVSVSAKILGEIDVEVVAVSDDMLEGSDLNAIDVANETVETVADISATMPLSILGYLRYCPILGPIWVRRPLVSLMEALTKAHKRMT